MGIKFVSVNSSLLNDFFEWLVETNGVANKTHNNYHINLSSVYNYYKKKYPKIIPVNICEEVSRLQVEKGGKHKPFTDAQLSLIHAEIIDRNDMQLFLFVNFIYYTFVRPTEELRFLKIEHINLTTIFIPAEISKNKRGEHVIIPPGLEKLIVKFKLRQYPPDFYIFTASGIPGAKMAGVNFFYKRHRAILESVNLFGLGYDIYGYKHSGNCKLFLAGADIKQIQRQNRHKTLEQTDNYLKDLGLIRNDEVFNKFPEFPSVKKEIIIILESNLIA